MDVLLKHRWPGNVRELENVIERAVVLAETQLLKEGNLPTGQVRMTGSPGAGDDATEYSLKVARRDLERRMISKALKATGGNRSQSARLLEISHPSLLSKMKLYGIS